MPKNGQFQVRNAVDGDVAFITSTWLQSYKFDSGWASRIRWQVFRAGHEPVVMRLLARSTCLVACDPTREEEILGYLVAEPPRLVAHYAYVKPAFRRAGVLRALIAASGLPPDLAGVSVTHGTRSWFSAQAVTDAEGRVLRAARPGLEDRFPAALHDPYPAFEVTQ